MMYCHQSYSDKHARQLTEAAIANQGYTRLVKVRVEEGYDAYLLTFMFTHISTRSQAVRPQMEAAVEQAYAYLVTRVLRYPNSEENRAQPLIWIAIYDRPVPKRQKKHIAEVTINDGLHMHAIALVPPWNRLKRPFNALIEHEQKRLVQAPLYRVHAKCIEHTPERAVDYVFKGLKRGYATLDDILVFPRSRSELTR